MGKYRETSRTVAPTIVIFQVWNLHSCLEKERADPVKDELVEFSKSSILPGKLY
jgi:hypothetical protein